MNSKHFILRSNSPRQLQKCWDTLYAKRGAAIGAVLALVALNSCGYFEPLKVESSVPPIASPSASTEIAAQGGDRSLLWSSTLVEENWQQHWGVSKSKDWGLDNLAIIPDPEGRFGKILRVAYPAKSASPTVSRKHKVPLGGCQFLADLNLAPQDALRLSYYVRFSDDFDFVKGGKLPGLFGGDSQSGGDDPDGTNGFSTRFMWRKNGAGELYAYLPTSKKKEYGTSIGRGQWQFKPGVWYRLEQEVILNQPGLANGQVRVWLDGQQVLNKTGLMFRSTDQLKINGIFFSTFFGGNDKSWATPRDVHVDFANFAVTPVQRSSRNGG